MKKLVTYILCIGLLFSCSEDDGDTIDDISGPAFTFKISGSINRTISGSAISYTETTTDVKNFELENVKLTTILIVAQADNNEDQVTFAITKEGTNVGTGNYQVGTDLFTLYNAFLNFSGDRGKTTDFQSESGNIRFDSKSSGLTAGSINIDCPAKQGEGSIKIRGEFVAENLN